MPRPTPTVPLHPASRVRQPRRARLLGDGEPANLPPTAPLPPSTPAPDNAGRNDGGDGNTTTAATPQPPSAAASGSDDGEGGIAVSIVFGTLAGVCYIPPLFFV